MASKPGIVKGTRDFGPRESARRQYLFQTIRKHFERCGFQPVETPAMETLETLTGKYGEEGDRLIFKILNSGDYKAKVDVDQWQTAEASALTPFISEKALRYDLTVPFARFVVMRRNDLSFPFRRYQIQPVWRADKPQKGRYREFYQCDADIIGSESLTLEAELISLFYGVLQELQIPGFRILLNNRKILAGMAEAMGRAADLVPITVALDKLDKIGAEGVLKEMAPLNLDDQATDVVERVMALTGSTDDKLQALENIIGGTASGQKGLEEIRDVLAFADAMQVPDVHLHFQPTLARGLNYYTGAIFEVVVPDASVGSICGGGRYDDLTGIFGWPGMSGIGISFGADRIYDVLEEFNLFPEQAEAHLDILVTRFPEVPVTDLLRITQNLRAEGWVTELYPDAKKLKKQFKYANDRMASFVIAPGGEEWSQGEVSVKQMSTGEQQTVPVTQLTSHLKSLL